LTGFTKCGSVKAQKRECSNTLSNPKYTVFGFAWAAKSGGLAAFYQEKIPANLC